MQTFPQKGFLKRILFYWSRLYPQDLEEGDDYEKTPSAHSLVFTTFSVLDKKMKKCVNSFSMRADDPPHEQLTEDLKIVIVELNKFKKEYTELLDLQDIWCYLLLHSSELTAKAYKHLSRHKEAQMALEHLSKISEDQRLKQAALTREKTRRDYYWHLANAKKEGMAEGMAEGMKEGIAEGMAEGMKEGMAEGMEKGMEKGIAKGVETVALRMLKDGYKLSAISKMTGLSEADIKKLK